MALHLNLYHEVQKARKLQRRDPLKLSIYGLAGIAALFAIYYIFELSRMHVLSVELTKAQAEFSALEPKAKAAKQREEEISLEVRKSDLMMKRIEERFYWAPMLEQISQTVPREVQITRLVGDLTGEGMRKCSLTLDGISAGADPRKVAEDLRTAIAEHLTPKYKAVTSSFKSLEDGTEMVLLDGRQMPTASFAINVQLTTAGEEPAPPPVARKKR
jgi:Tfp pilus assembly protein PilN